MAQTKTVKMTAPPEFVEWCKESGFSLDEGFSLLFRTVRQGELSGLIETMYLKSIPGMEQAIVEGLNAPKSDFVEIDWRKELEQ